jgi:hypothetical protein
VATGPVGGGEVGVLLGGGAPPAAAQTTITAVFAGSELSGYSTFHPAFTMLGAP